MGQPSKVRTPLGVEYDAYPVSCVLVDRDVLIEAVGLAADDERFDHRKWAPMGAETLERLARRIREGYEAEARARQPASPGLPDE